MVSGRMNLLSVENISIVMTPKLNASLQHQCEEEDMVCPETTPHHVEQNAVPSRGKVGTERNIILQPAKLSRQFCMHISTSMEVTVL